MESFSRKDFPTLLLLFTILILTIFYVPFVSETSRLFVYCYLFGFWGKRIFQKKEKDGAITSIIISVCLSGVMFLILGLLSPPGSLITHSILAGIALILFWFSAKVPQRKEQTDISKSHLYIIISFVILPLIPIIYRNPGVGFISDGWWHASIFNLISTTTLPPMNPWLAGVPVGYPFFYHLFLANIFSQTQTYAHHIFIFCSVLGTILLAIAVYLLARQFYTPRQALWTSFTYYAISSIGSIMFLVDIIRYTLRGTLFTEYITFLFKHSGPHMWYSAMKFIHPAGINITFNGPALVGSLQLFFVVVTFMFFLRRQYFLTFLAYAGLVSSNPIIAFIVGVTLGIASLFRGWKPLMKTAAIGIGAAIVNISYLYAIALKAEHISRSTLAAFDGNAFGMMTVFIIGYLPLIILAGIQFREKKYSSETKILFFAYMLTNLIVMFSLQLGYLYASFTLFIALAVIAGPQFAKINGWRGWKNMLLLAIVIVGVASTSIITLTYGYYVYNLDKQELAASDFLRLNSPENAVILVDMGDLWVRNLRVYPSAFGARQVYIADAINLDVYGEDFTLQEEKYNTFWKNLSCANLPEEVSYVYTKPTSPSLEELSCLHRIYDTDIDIYAKT